MTEDEFHDLKGFLDEKADLYENPAFLESDPIQIPHIFSQKEDIEIAGLLTATIAWGQRKTIIANAHKMVKLLDSAPYHFVVNHQDKDLNSFKGFVHRTFNHEDLAFFIRGLKHIYTEYGGLEKVFTATNAHDAIVNFRRCMLQANHDRRSEKHLANPASGSSAKRLCMYLRWMSRPATKGVDFGIWNFPLHQLLCPLDVHTGNVARKLNLLTRKQNDWTAVEELTTNLRMFDPVDPVRYDFALFGLGAFEGW